MPNRYITVPLNRHAAEQLDFDLAPPDQLMEIELSDEGVYYALWKTGIFQLINQHCGSMIDDFEDTAITGEEMRKGMQAISGWNAGTKDGVLLKLLDRIKALFQVAVERNTQIHFYF